MVMAAVTTTAAAYSMVAQISFFSTLTDVNLNIVRLEQLEFRLDIMRFDANYSIFKPVISQSFFSLADSCLFFFIPSTI